MQKTSLFILFLLFSLSMMSQESTKDFRTWTSVQLNYKAGNKITLKAKPIARYRSGYGDYNLTTIDLMIAYKFNSTWNAQILSRRFIIPDAGDREFYFFDIRQNIPVSDKIAFNHGIRYHLALDWNRNDSDFLRYQPKVTFKKVGNFTPFIGYDIFYRISDDVGVAGVRYQAGVNWKLADRTGLSLTYWNQDDYSDRFTLPNAHILVINFAHNLN